jgi:lipoate-protein ligase B
MVDKLVSVLSCCEDLDADENVLLVHRWSQPVGYASAYDLQKRIWAQRVAGNSPDTLLIFEHTPTFTAGKSGKMENLLIPIEALSKRGISLFFIDRGGDFTYHGPGQLVAYPILDLNIHGKDVQKYIHNLEEVIIRTLADFSIIAGRDEQHVGVWVGNQKIAAIGVSIRRWVTMHGLAINVNNNLEHFSLINPCGILDKGVTSMARVLSAEIPVKEVCTRLINHFGRIFNIPVKLDSTNSARWKL